MLPTHVALVPYEKELVATQELLHVAAALQTQLTRDVNPLWDVVGIVSPFAALPDVPPGYLPLVIVANGSLETRERAFHFAPGGQPLALLEHRQAAGWSLAASHELIEMICDPWGNRTVRGSSLESSQGQVEYLVEVCDPCQHSTYLINGVTVSDFVTPLYYGPVAADGQRYSFTGSVKRPRQLGPGGYISWRAGGLDAQIWQATADKNGKPHVAPLTSGAPTLTRAWVDSHTPAKTGVPTKLAPGAPQGGSKKALERARDSAKLYGERLEADIASVLGALKPQPPPSIDDVLALLEKLANNRSYWTKFQENYQKELSKHNIDPDGIEPLDPFPSQEQYARVLEGVKRGKALGPGFDQPELAQGLLTLGMFGMTS